MYIVLLTGDGLRAICYITHYSIRGHNLRNTAYTVCAPCVTSYCDVLRHIVMCYVIL